MNDAIMLIVGVITLIVGVITLILTAISAIFCFYFKDYYKIMLVSQQLADKAKDINFYANNSESGVLTAIIQGYALINNKKFSNRKVQLILDDFFEQITPSIWIYLGVKNNGEYPDIIEKQFKDSKEIFAKQIDKKNEDSKK
jgi:hypothetical protein